MKDFQPGKFFLFSSIVLVPISFFFRQQTLDLIIHDTYFLVSLKSLCWFIIILLLIFWLIYLKIHALRFSPLLSLLHTALTLIPVFILILMLAYTNGLTYQKTTGNLPFDQWQKFNQFGWMTTLELVCISLFAIAQISFLFNLIYAAGKKK